MAGSELYDAGSENKVAEMQMRKEEILDDQDFAEYQVSHCHVSLNTFCFEMKHEKMSIEFAYLITTEITATKPLLLIIAIFRRFIEFLTEIFSL